MIALALVALSCILLSASAGLIAIASSSGRQRQFLVPPTKTTLITDTTKTPRNRRFHFYQNSLNNHNEENHDETKKDKTVPFPQLPPVASGISKLQEETVDKEFKDITLGGDSQPVAFVAREKFELQYTCNVCETRNSHKVSRMAYRKGVVIAVCKGCKTRHMIADNLGWTNYKGGFEGNTNIEEYMEAKGRGDNVTRVSTDVFSLEKSLHLQSPPEAGSMPIDSSDSNSMQ